MHRKGLPRRAILALLAMTAYFFASEISYRPRNKRAYVNTSAVSSPPYVFTSHSARAALSWIL
ncbi:MAG: hypothetical protein K6C94_01910, partial [Candidatus Gastranaerophilales bacterium]|nr:hypothetical protein [Candidatus Gastranaerophilales bacterium]